MKLKEVEKVAAKLKCWRCPGHLQPHQSIDYVFICGRQACGALYTYGLIKELTGGQHDLRKM